MVAGTLRSNSADPQVPQGSHVTIYLHVPAFSSNPIHTDVMSYAVSYDLVYLSVDPLANMDVYVSNPI